MLARELSDKGVGRTSSRIMGGTCVLSDFQGAIGVVLKWSRINSPV